jgi:hypothetical protein
MTGGVLPRHVARVSVGRLTEQVRQIRDLRDRTRRPLSIPRFSREPGRDPYRAVVARGGQEAQAKRPVDETRDDERMAGQSTAPLPHAA